MFSFDLRLICGPALPFSPLDEKLLDFVSIYKL